MAREKAPPPPPDDVPLWFMTYSDVITLMMTFFILLLTFATNEPERFEQMKVAVFGASGAPGLAGDPSEGVENDSWVMRTRSRSSRLTNRGSEMPPLDRQASLATLDKGLSGLEEDEHQLILNVVTMDVPARQFATADGKLYEFGMRNLELVADMLTRKAYEITFEVAHPSELARANVCVQYLFQQHSIASERLGVALKPTGSFDASKIRMVFKSKGQEQGN